MRILIFILILLPFGSIAQKEPYGELPLIKSDGELLFTRMFSLTSPIQILSVLSESKFVSAPQIDLTTKNSEESNLVSLQAGVISSDFLNTVMYDSISIDTSIARILLFSTSNNFQFPDLSKLQGANKPIHEDSMLINLSESYKLWSSKIQNDGEYLKHDLFLIGEWIEANYILSCAAVRDSNELIIQRIGEQGNQVKRVIERLNEMGDKEHLSSLITEMMSLQITYNKINLEYQYAEPTQNTEKRVTTFGHSNKTEIPDGIAQEINEQLTIIRSMIIN